MKKYRWLWLPVLGLGLVAGCCSNPGVFQKVETSLETIQNFYDPLIQGNLQDDRVKQAVVAADTTLLLAGELQKQWCPDPNQVQQLELQTGEAQGLAQKAGVPTGTAGH
jgi:hypothetical protein